MTIVIDMKCGIYKITNTINSKSYIGSSKNIRRRWRSHVSKLKRGVHENKHLQSSWSKYGYVNFIFELIEKCCDDNLMEKEQLYLTLAKLTPDKYYNNSFDAECPSRIMKPESYKRMSESAKKRAQTDEGKRNASIAGSKTKIFTDIHKINISKSKRGKKADPTEYHWVNSKSGEKFVGTKYNWYSQFCQAGRRHHYKWATRLVTGERKSYKGWTVDKSPTDDNIST